MLLIFRQHNLRLLRIFAIEHGNVANLLHEFRLMRLRNMGNHFCLNVIGDIAEFDFDEFVTVQGAIDFPVNPFADTIGTNQYHGMQMMRLRFQKTDLVFA